MSGFRSGGPDLWPYINESHHVQVFVCWVMAMQHVAPCIRVNLHQDFCLLATWNIDDILPSTLVQWNRCRSSIAAENTNAVDVDVEWMVPATATDNEVPAFRRVCPCGKQWACWIPEAAVDLPATVAAVELNPAGCDDIADIWWWDNPQTLRHLRWIWSVAVNDKQ